MLLLSHCAVPDPRCPARRAIITYNDCCITFGRGVPFRHSGGRCGFKIPVQTLSKWSAKSTSRLTTGAVLSPSPFPPWLTCCISTFDSFPSSCWRFKAAPFTPRHHWYVARRCGSRSAGRVFGLQLATVRCGVCVVTWLPLPMAAQAKMWKEYAKADSRWGVFDPNVVSLGEWRGHCTSEISRAVRVSATPSCWRRRDAGAVALRCTLATV